MCPFTVLIYNVNNQERKLFNQKYLTGSVVSDTTPWGQQREPLR